MITIRACALALLALAGCSKRCGHATATDDASPSPSASASAIAVVSTIEASAPPAPPPAASTPPIEVPAGCLDIATDFAWRKAIVCQHESACTPDEDLDGGRLVEWKRHDVDLDGDGVKEVVLACSFAQNSPGDPEVHVYLGDAACATHVTTMSSEFEVLATRHDGWLDLKVVDGESFCEGVFGCGCRASETFYVHKGGDYVEDPSRKIEGKTGHCPQQGDPCTKNSDCAPTGLACVAGQCAIK